MQTHIYRNMVFTNTYLSHSFDLICQCNEVTRRSVEGFMFLFIKVDQLFEVVIFK